MTKRNNTFHVAAAALLFALLLQTSNLAIAVSKPIVTGTEKLNNNWYVNNDEILDSSTMEQIMPFMAQKNNEVSVNTRIKDARSRTHQRLRRIDDNESNVGNERRRTVVSSTVQKSRVHARIINGSDAKKGRYSYIVSLTLKGNHVCGGTLIAPDMILSAAHCSDFIDGASIGRHNVDDEMEVFEKFVFEKVINHPKFNQDENDGSLDYDFLLLKLYGQSQFPTAKLNSNPNIPKDVGDSLTVAGWGVINEEKKTTASVLQHVEVKYITNKQCEAIEGFLPGHLQLISQKGIISDAMMCAKDKDEDACQGDSGGPLVILGESEIGLDDLLVGVVSWGLGCAHEHFPGVYARVSHEIGWIAKIACEWTETRQSKITNQFCPRETNITNTTKPSLIDGTNSTNSTQNVDEDGSSRKESKQPLTVFIQLDRYPHETGWLIRSLGDDGIMQTDVYSPIGTYKGQETMKVVQIVLLEPDKTYEFIMLDAYGDGLAFDNAHYSLYRFIDGKNDIILQKSGKFTHSIKHIFTFTKKTWSPTPPPTHAPTSDNIPTPPLLTSTPTVTPTTPLQPTPPTSYPSYSPSQKRASIIIEIKFDKNPEQVGWLISSLQNQVTIDSKPTGSYFDQPHSTIEEQVWLYGPEYGSQQYLFAIFDNGSDGLCCDNGPGFYNVYLEGDLLFGGDIYTNLEEYVFTIEWPTSAPTITDTSSSTMSPTMSPYYSSTSFPTSTLRHQNVKIDFNLLRPPTLEKEEKSIVADKPPKQTTQDNDNSPTPSSKNLPTPTSTACFKQLDTVSVAMGLSTVFLLLIY